MCRMGENFSGECAALENQMLCNLNCPGSSTSSRNETQGWSWGPSEWPCVSDLQAAPSQPTVLVEPATDTPWILATVIGSAVVALVLLTIGFCTCRQMSRGREAMEADRCSAVSKCVVVVVVS